MKALILITALLSVSACQAAPYAGVAAMGAVTGISLTTNYESVEEFGDKYLKVGE